MKIESFFVVGFVIRKNPGGNQTLEKEKIKIDLGSPCPFISPLAKLFKQLNVKYC